MTSRPSVIACATVAVAAIGEVATVILGWDLTSLTAMLEWALLNLTLTCIGALILHRLPRHPVGWVLVIDGMLGSITADALGAYGLRAAHAGWPGAAQAIWLPVGTWGLGALMWVIMLLYIPTGRLPARGWSTVLYGATIGAVVLTVGWLTDPASVNPTSSVPNPFVLDGLPSAQMVVVGNVLLAAGGIGAVASVIWRIRGADAVLRQQLKWVAVCGAIVAAFMPLAMVFWFDSALLRVLAPFVLTAAVAALGAAVLRYRLFDVDRLVLRALAYAVALVLGVGIYATVTVSLGALVGGSRPWQVAAATLGAALAFRPVARLCQRMLDRRFDKDHAARARVDRYLDGLRAGTERAEQVEEILRTASGVPGLTLLLHLATSDGYADVRGRALVPDAANPTVRLWDESKPVAIAQYPGPEDPMCSARINRLLEHARLALQIARLGIELNRQVDELSASQRRLSAAADTERRRIQRDLHDGAQQRLVTVGLALRSVEARLRRRSETDDADTLDGLVADLQETIAELRALTSDLPLPQLDAGIEAAFRELAVRSPIPVHVEVDAGQLDAAVEATAYFLGSEGLTNVLKHAHASAATLSALRLNGTLQVSVADDGVGGARLGTGSGLRGLRDRVTALGGHLQIESDHTGTLLTAELPCD